MHEDPIIEAVPDGQATPSPARPKPAPKRESGSANPVVRVEIYTDAASRHSGGQRNGRGPRVEAHPFTDHQEESLEAAELAALASQLAATQIELDEREHRLVAAQTGLDERERRVTAEGQRVCEELERLAAKEQEIAERDSEFVAVEMLESERLRIERRSRYLDDLEEKMRERLQELAGAEADFELRLDSLERREDAVEELERRIEQKESDLSAYVAQLQGQFGRSGISAVG
jgi:DNA repair exonuclease SbcCD ATPase subunit